MQDAAFYQMEIGILLLCFTLKSYETIPSLPFFVPSVAWMGFITIIQPHVRPYYKSIEYEPDTGN